MLYAHVENGNITYQGTLPETWRNISGLYLSEGNAAFLEPLGWLPVIVTEITPTFQQARDEDQVTVGADQVVVVQRVREKTADEIAADWRELRIQRNHFLSSSDWTAVTDNNLTAEQKAAWTTYRQALRDLPTTVDITTWPDVWPTEPA